MRKLKIAFLVSEQAAGPILADLSGKVDQLSFDVIEAKTARAAQTATNRPSVPELTKRVSKSKATTKREKFAYKRKRLRGAAHGRLHEVPTKEFIHKYFQSMPAGTQLRFKDVAAHIAHNGYHDNPFIELKQLVETGVIVKQGKGHGSYYMLHPIKHVPITGYVDNVQEEQEEAVQ